MEREKGHNSKVLVFLLLFNSLLVISPLFSWLLPFSEVYAVVTFVILVFYLIFFNIKLNIRYLLVAFVLIFGSLVPSLYWLELRYFFYPSFFLVALLLVTICGRNEIAKFVDLSTNIILLLLAASVVGFILAKLGFDYTLKFKNPDGRWNYLYYTTLTNYVRGDFIRPSAIFDEPGTFSFVICLTAFFRFCLGRDFKLTWIILFLGFITFSLAHLIFCTIFLFAERFNAKRISFFLGLLLSAFLIFTFTGFSSTISDKLLGRLEITEEGTVKGDNRTVLMGNALSEIEKKNEAVLVGLDPDCLFNVPVCKEEYPLMGANPVTPLVFQGLFVSWPYYLLIILSCLSLFVHGRSGLAFFAVGLLFLQRPYLMLAGYSLLGVLAVQLVYANKLKIGYSGHSSHSSEGAR